MPQTPNFKPGVGQLATSRYDFQSHLDGTNFRHNAPEIDLKPAITIGAATFTDVQSILTFFAGGIAPPTVPDATVSSKGVIQLGGDLAGTGTSALAPRVSGLNGQPLSLPTTPTTSNVLTWNGGAWVASTIPVATSVQPAGAIVMTGDLAGGGLSPVVAGLQGRPVSATAPGTNQVLAWNGTQWAPASASGTPSATSSSLGTVQLAGDLAGVGSVATAPRVGSLNGATVPTGSGLTTGNVLQVSGAAALSYGFIADANVSPTAAIQGTKITPSFGAQNISQTTSNTASFGPTTITGALVAGSSTAVNTLTGSFAITTRTITSSLVVDTTTTDYVIFVNASSSLNITLPAPTNGRRLIIKDIAGTLSSTVLINMIQHSTEKIEGLAATKTLGTPWGSWTFVSNGTDWFMI